jgi:hypothetical protein
MSDMSAMDEAKRFAVEGARLEVRLKEAEVAEKKKAWRTFANPATLVALQTAQLSNEPIECLGRAASWQQ